MTVEPDAHDRLRDAAATLTVAVRAHPDELNLAEVRRCWAEVGDALDALEAFCELGELEALWQLEEAKE